MSQDIPRWGSPRTEVLSVTGLRGVSVDTQDPLCAQHPRVKKEEDPEGVSGFAHVQAIWWPSPRHLPGSGVGSWPRGSPQLRSFASSFAEKHEPCWQEVWQGCLFFLSKERVSWRRLDTVEKSPGGRGIFEAGRISEASRRRSVGSSASGAVAPTKGTQTSSSKRRGQFPLRGKPPRAAGGVSGGPGAQQRLNCLL